MAKKPAKKRPAPKAPKTKSPTRMRIREQAILALSADGRIKASELVQAAADPRHPMHVDFEWNDSKAGHQYRLAQARSYIAEVRTVITTSTKQVVAPAYVRDRNIAPREGYIATSRLQSDREAAEELLLYETTRLQAQLERCREIAAALELEDELEAALAAVNTMASRIRRSAPTSSVHATA